ncbi:MAG: hypothetical protein EXR49_06765 [Dehalococcoidia bacterium]|nr:hypothetical protein [Dehalococcoidia bacterium]
MSPAAAGPPPPIARLERRAFHLCAASIFPTLLLFFPRWPVLLAALALLAAHLAFDGTRLRIPAVNAWACRVFAPLMKERERQEPVAATYLIIATCIAIAAFQPIIASLALYFVAIGDPLAALVGQRWGRHRLGRRSVEGSAAFLAGALGIGALVASAAGGASYAVMALGAITATLAELAPLPLDDNLKVPLVAAPVMALAAML